MPKTAEVEIKLPVADPAAMRRALLRLGLRPHTRRTLERNVVYDTPRGALRAGGLLLRLRRYGRNAIVTYKGPQTPGRHKVREEREVLVGDAGLFAAIIERLGFRPVFYYEKYRAIFGRPSANHAALDETPIGDFLELEGSPSWIDSIARRLGFQHSDYITASYGRLFLDYCEATGIKSNRMEFSLRKSRFSKVNTVVRKSQKRQKAT